MKNSILFFLVYLPVYVFPGIHESFSDGNFTDNPVWNGTISNFKVNTNFQLQSSATSASTSHLFTYSNAIENATWECKLNFDYPTSSTNYSCIYIISDDSLPENGFRGYFVQIGGTNDEISLYLQEGTKKTKIIDGFDKRTDGKNPEIFLKVTRDSSGIFSLYSRLSTESAFVLEGEVLNTTVTMSKFFGLSFTNTATTGTCYYFDDIRVDGNKITDNISPQWLNLTVASPAEIRCSFSEPVVYQQLKLKIDDVNVDKVDVLPENQDSVLHLKFNDIIEMNGTYRITLSGIFDKSGNCLADSIKQYFAVQEILPGDVVFNEVMFHQPDSSYEYVELINTSQKLIDISGMIITTRKADGTLNTGFRIPEKSYIFPLKYIAFTQEPDVVMKFHHTPDTAHVIKSSWVSLNNESATLLLTDNQRNIIFDEFAYDVAMHHVMIKNPQGVALEKIYANTPSSDFNNWHSASSLVLFGTPGYRNSQFRSEIENREVGTFCAESDYFTPDNDGVSDIFIVNYQLEEPGFMANVQVFSNSGEKMINLYENELLMTEGKIYWDGRTDKCRTAVPGIYVMYIDTFHPLKGKRIRHKIPLVVSYR